MKFNEDEHMTKINALDNEISKLTDVFSIDVQMNTGRELRTMIDLLKSLNEPVRRLLDESSLSTQVLQDSQRLHLLRWLSPVPFSSHHKQNSKNRMVDSCQWLLTCDKYLDWRKTSSSSILLLHGIMGSGKTLLASAVIDSFLQEYSGQVSPAPFAFFYCSRNQAEAERSNATEILRSILRQLTVLDGSSSKVHQSIVREYENRQAKAKLDGFDVNRLEATECIQLILDTTAANSATVIVDALDEIESSSRYILTSALTRIVQESLNVVKVFLTSRDDSSIHARLPDAVALRIQKEHVFNDMSKFVHQKISVIIQNRSMLNGVISDELKQDLVRVLIDGAGEM